MTDTEMDTTELALRNIFHLPPTLVDHCSIYYLRHWELEYLLDKMDVNPMQLENEGIIYKLIFVDNLNWKEHWQQVRISFRKHTNEKYPAYALVKGI